jgi:hypothetical protein
MEIDEIDHTYPYVHLPLYTPPSTSTAPSPVTRSSAAYPVERQRTTPGKGVT